MSYISFYVIFPDKDTASNIIHQVVSERLAACGNSFQVNSCYLWHENVENEVEIAAIIKTSVTAAEGLLKRIESLHPYEVPCISFWVTNANTSYEDWIEKSTTSNQ
ncbi:MAG TPA: divalent-cation tolerance protein CutA [Saprospiraceae bacterium]|nr:divalent-cation tolerance protein CutA [Saprospiraceae bacterium]